MVRPAEPRLRSLTITLPAHLVESVVECAGTAHQTVDRFIEGVLRHEVTRWGESFPGMAADAEPEPGTAPTG